MGTTLLMGRSLSIQPVLRRTSADSVLSVANVSGGARGRSTARFIWLNVNCPYCLRSFENHADWVGSTHASLEEDLSDARRGAVPAAAGAARSVDGRKPLQIVPSCWTL